MKTWKELQKGDILYVLVPNEDENGTVTYAYQECVVINVSSIKHYIAFKFKYTDNTGKRIRVNIQINDERFDLNTVTQYNGVLFNKIDFGDLLVTFKGKDFLKKAYNDMIDRELKRHQSIIENYNNIIKEL